MSGRWEKQESRGLPRFWQEPRLGRTGFWGESRSCSWHIFNLICLLDIPVGMLIVPEVMKDTHKCVIRIQLYLRPNKS